MIEMSCPACGKKLRVGDDAAGKRGKCPQCSTAVRIPTRNQAGRDAEIEAWLSPPQSDQPSTRAGPASGSSGQSSASRSTQEIPASNLMACPDCGRQVSRQAKACPNCGHPFQVAHDERPVAAFRAEEKRKKAAKSESRAQIALLLLTLGCAGVAALFLASGSDRRGDTQMYVGDRALIAAVVFGLILIGGLPGSIARRRGHPSASAIAVCGWIGVFTLGIFWLVALIWAYTQPRESSR